MSTSLLLLLDDWPGYNLGVKDDWQKQKPQQAIQENRPIGNHSEERPTVIDAAWQNQMIGSAAFGALVNEKTVLARADARFCYINPAQKTDPTQKAFYLLMKTNHK